MKSLFFLVLFFSIFSQAQVWDQALDATTPPAEFVARTFSESDFTTYPWLNEFTHIIVINKANQGKDRQTLRLYTNGKISLMTKVSTGRETFEAGCAEGQNPKTHHCSQRAYWSRTPVGYFDVDSLNSQYFSNLWQTWMPYAVFFEPGIAVHQAPAGTEDHLGRRASGGCIRSHPNVAPQIFSAVEKAGMGLIPVINRDGSLKKTTQGDVVRRQGFKTLVILQNQIK